MKKRFKSYEVLWFEDGNESFETKEFSQRRSALKFYEEHKNDKEKYSFWVTRRDHEWNVIENIVVE